MAQTAFLLGGQGAYRPGMFAGDTVVGEMLTVVDSIAAEFGCPGVRTLLLDPAAPTADQLARTDPFGLQLAVFAAAMGEYQKAALTTTPDIVVGHSLGELTALTAAGGFDLADGARLVCLRSQALLGAGLTPGGMLALELSERRAAHLVGAVGDRRVAVAVVNAPMWTVVAGPETSLDFVRRAADGLGVRTVALPAPFAFHSPGLAVAARSFAEAAASIRQLPLRLAVYSPLLGDYLADTVDFVALLVRHMTSPVNFLAAVRNLHADGVRRVVECGRSGLAGLVRDSVPGVSTDSQHAPAAVAQRPVPAVESTGVDVSEVVSQLREMYASTLGYPVEVVEADSDLEADLGIDSLKRAEMLGKVAAQFGLPASTNDGRFLAHTTLAELAEMIATTLETAGESR